MNEDCILIACPVPKNAVQSFANQYTLDGTVVGNEPLSVVVNGVTVFVPPGVITIPFPPTAPTSLTVQSCSGPITLPVPIGSTQGQVQQIAQSLANLAAEALAICNSLPPSSFPPIFLNAAQTFNCTIGIVIRDNGATYPAGVTLTSNGVQIQSGIFTSSVSQSAADQAALNFITLFLTNALASDTIECGWYNTEQTVTCPNGSQQTVGAGTFFSTISQADANAQAIASAEAACPPPICGAENKNVSDLTWADDGSQTDGGGSTESWTMVGGSGTFSATCVGSGGFGIAEALSSNICLETAYPIRFTWSFTINQGAQDGGGGVNLVFGQDPFLGPIHIAIDASAPNGAANGFFDFNPGIGVHTFLIHCAAQSSSGASISGTINITPLTPP